jgi:hypothetical protein
MPKNSPCQPVKWKIQRKEKNGDETGKNAFKGDAIDLL